MPEETREIKYPRGEIVKVTHYREKKPIFLITEKPTTGYYFIYEFTDSGLVRLGKSMSPLDLEEKYHVRERMGCT